MIPLVRAHDVLIELLVHAADDGLVIEGVRTAKAIRSECIAIGRKACEPKEQESPQADSACAAPNSGHEGANARGMFGNTALGVLLSGVPKGLSQWDERTRSCRPAADLTFRVWLDPTLFLELFLQFLGDFLASLLGPALDRAASAGLAVRFHRRTDDKTRRVSCGYRAGDPHSGSG